MMQFWARAGLAALLAAGTLTAATVPAFAQFDVYIGPDGGPPPPRFRGPPPPDFDRRPPPPGFGRPRGCDPRLAEDIARDFGFRRAHVVDITPRRVVVEGFTRRGPDEISFANVRGCPVLRR